MRISDWSSDVCSSDLLFRDRPRRAQRAAAFEKFPRRASIASPARALACRAKARTATGEQQAMTAPRQEKPLGTHRVGRHRVGRHRPEPSLSQEIIDLYDEYTHLTLDRRRFFDHLTHVAGGTAAAYALLPLLENNYAEAAMVAPDDSRLKTEKIRSEEHKSELQSLMRISYADLRLKKKKSKSQ